MGKYELIYEEGNWIILKVCKDSDEFVAAFADKQDAIEYLYQKQSELGGCEAWDMAGDR